MVRVLGKGGAVRWLMLGHEGQRSLFTYLDHYWLKKTTHFKQDNDNTEPLFLSETGHPLTKGAIGLLFGRLRKRVAMSRKDFRASLLRKNVAMRYVQTGGDQQMLLELLGQQKSLMITRSRERNNEFYALPHLRSAFDGSIASPKSSSLGLLPLSLPG